MTVGQNPLYDRGPIKITDIKYARAEKVTEVHDTHRADTAGYGKRLSANLLTNSSVFTISARFMIGGII